MRIDEIIEFYFNQDELSGVYTKAGLQESEDRKEVIKNNLSKPPLDILELGAGGGQRAFSTAQIGYNVTALELVPKLAENCKMLSSKLINGSLHVLQGDFYKIDLPQKFDAVVYWDGFGVGSDMEQKELLKRIKNWLKPGGSALIDIYTPWHAIRQIGVEMTFGKAKRRYDLDAENCRLIDTWWHLDQPQKKYSQSLRCYSPADFRMLLEGTDLKIAKIIYGGGFENDSAKYLEVAPSMDKAIWYTVRIVHDDKNI